MYICVLKEYGVGFYMFVYDGTCMFCVCLGVVYIWSFMSVELD